MSALRVGERKISNQSLTLFFFTLLIRVHLKIQLNCIYRNKVEYFHGMFV